MRKLLTKSKKIETFTYLAGLYLAFGQGQNWHLAN